MFCKIKPVDSELLMVLISGGVTEGDEEYLLRGRGDQSCLS